MPRRSTGGRSASADRHVGGSRHPRAAPRAVVPVELEQALHAVAVSGVGLQQLGEAVVVDRGAGEGPADVLGHVVVTEAHLVGQTQRPLGHLGPGPAPDAGQGGQPGARRLDRKVGALLEAAGVSDGSHDGAPAAGVDAGGEPLPRGDGRPAARVGRHGEAEVLPRARCRLTEAAHQSPVAREGLLAGDLLLGYPGHQCLHDTSPDRGTRQPGEAPPGLRHQRVVGDEGRRVVTLAEQVGHALERPRRPPAPCGRRDLTGARRHGQAQRHRTVGRAPGEPPPTVVPPARGVAATAAEYTRFYISCPLE